MNYQLKIRMRKGLMTDLQFLKTISYIVQRFLHFAALQSK